MISLASKCEIWINIGTCARFHCMLYSFSAWNFLNVCIF